jgi:hypothetical protein
MRADDFKKNRHSGVVIARYRPRGANRISACKKWDSESILEKTKGRERGILRENHFFPHHNNRL